jgi:hypothetical protein
MFRRFIGNVYRGLVFERFNIRMLQHIAYGLVAMWVFDKVYSGLFYYFIAKNLSFEHLEITGKFESSSFMLIAVLLLWVLSHILCMVFVFRKIKKLTV